ncbi:hypothetical protein CARUB_v10022290mg [Capsella rubella]|uniref:Uncharacterized protein n=1 Tax=Capsella rubella TaxID=81985 RepID=R0HXY2_9BRAS|nr:UPF0496 protein At3g57100 [Capsella rubella]EOA34719.1 hypothetical protein CARUB_v10022290mg [Capsella rubella]
MTFKFCKRSQPKSSVSTSSSSSSTIGDTKGMLKSRSEDNLNKLGNCMDNMDEDVSKLFMEFQQTDLREDPELFRLLNGYFNTTKNVSHLCESLRICLERGKNKDGLFIGEALCEDLDYCMFLEEFKTCHEDLAKMIVKLEKTMKQIDKKLKRVRGRRAIVAAALLIPVVVGIFVSKVVAGIFGLIPIEPLTSFVSSRWKKATEALKRKKTAMSSMERGTMVALKEVEKITRLVTRLETVERSIRVATVPIKKRSLVAMGEVEEERKSLKSTLVDLDRETGLCDGFAQFGRTVALEKITEFLSRGEKKSSAK